MRMTSAEYQELLKKKTKKKNKLHAVASESEGYRYDSQKEARYAETLRLRQKVGEIKYFLRQIPFHLSAKPRVTYRCDFMVVSHDGVATYWEVKGFMTDTARAKIAWCEQLYGVKINIV